MAIEIFVYHEIVSLDFICGEEVTTQEVRQDVRLLLCEAFSFAVLLYCLWQCLGESESSDPLI